MTAEPTRDMLFAQGVFSVQRLMKAIADGWIVGTPSIEDRQLQPASLDLRLGDRAHRLKCSFLPGRQTVANCLAEYSLGPPLHLEDGAVLEVGRPYLIPLIECLDLPKGIEARANPKSSTGRLDIFTRVITDKGNHFDDVAEGYTGPLYLEVVSRSFTIKLTSGLSLNQLRLQTVGTSHIGDAPLRRLNAEDPLLYRNGRQVSSKELPLSNGLFLTLELNGSSKSVGWRARPNSGLIDLELIGAHDPTDFWEPVRPERGGGVILAPEAFYLLLSREGVRIPTTLASEMTAYDPTSGELRSHYAGFFDPGFGHGFPDGGFGSRAALEVRAHDVPFKVQNGQRVCKLVYLSMTEEPDILYGSGSNYQFQVEALSKHFARTKRAAPISTRMSAGATVPRP